MSQYTLSLNYAGGLGLAPENTRIGIYLDGQQIGSYANTSPDSGLDWKTISFSFQGNGKHRELSIQLEGAGTDTPRSAMLDAIQVIETFPNSADTVYGLENTAIRLPRIDSNLTEGDTGATLKTELIGLPKGTTLSDGIHQVTIKTRNTVLDLAGWNLARLTLTPPKGHEDEISLQIRATSTEDSNGSSAAITRGLTVKILDGKACATPAGVNPYVSYLNQGAVTASSRPILVAGALLPEDRSCGIYLPGGSTPGHEEAGSDEAMERWMDGLEHSLNSAFMDEMRRVLRGEG